MDKQSYNIRVPKRWARLAMIVVVTAVVAVPLTALASHQFTDVPNSNIFHDDIAWLADAGVTKGCNPPANTEFCPDDATTRAQMAAFMRRFAQYLGAEDGTPAQADSVNGVAIHRFFHQAPTGTTDEEIGTFGPITLYATCSAGNVPTLRASWDETVNHLTFEGDTGALFGNATVNADEVINIGSGPFGSVGLAEAVGFSSHTQTSVEYFLRRSAALGDTECFFSGFVTIG